MITWTSKIALAALIVPVGFRSVKAGESENAAFSGANALAEASIGLKTLLSVRAGAALELEGPLRLAAEPVDSDELDRRFSNALDVDVQLDLNDDRTRVGSRAWICDPLMPHQPDAPPDNCQEIDYVFPQLRFDAASKSIFFGQRLVARDRGYWGGIKMEKGLKLDYRVVERRIDTGWDHRQIEAMEVSIIEKAQR